MPNTGLGTGDDEMDTAKNLVERNTCQNAVIVVFILGHEDRTKATVTATRRERDGFKRL